MIFVPIFRGQDFGGFIVGAFRTDKFLDSLTKPSAEEIRFSVYDGENEIYSLGPNPPSNSSGNELTYATTVRYKGLEWKIRSWPDAVFLKRARSHIPSLTLLFGGLLAVFVSFLTHFAQKARLTAEAVREANAKLGHEVREGEKREEELRKISRAVEQSPVSIVVTDKNGTIEYVNPKFTEVTGYSLDEAIGQNPRILKSTAHSPEFYKNLWDTVLSGREWKGEFLNKDKKGNHYWEFASISPVKNRDGIITHFVGVKENITERKIIETKLRESEERFKGIFNFTGAVIFLKDLEGRYLMVNRQCEKLFKVRSGEIAGKFDREIFPGNRELVDRFGENDRKVAEAGGPLEFEEIVPQEDGLHAYISIKFPLRDADGKIYAVCGIATDITERKRMEEALRRSEELVRSMVATAMDGIIIIRDDGKIESINPAAERIFGYRAEELAGRNVSALMPEPYRQEHDGYISAYLRTGRAKILGMAREVTALRKGGETFPLEISVSETLLENRRMFTGIVRDISERKRVEEELKLYRERLERLVEERTAELKKVHERFVHSEKLSALGKLTGSIAHEFNNPIYGLRNIMDQTRESPHLTEEQKYLLNLGVKECDRMADLVRKLRGFYKPSTGTAERLDIRQVLDDMALLLQKQLKTRKIELKRDYAPNLPRIVAVEDQMKQVFLNLLQNAEESIPGEGGTITVAAESPNGDWVKISIKDTGGGIPPENIQLIFEPFFTTKSVKGTGLGLFVCYGIVKAHGGNIEISSEMGHGTVFTVTLPAKGVAQ